MDEFDTLAQEFGGAAAPAGGQDLDALAAEVGGQVAPQGLVPSQNEMAQAQAAGELEQALRTPGMTPEQIRRMGLQGRQPLNSDVDAMNQRAIDYYARGGQQSPQFQEPTVFGPDGLPSTTGGAIMRGALDPVSANYLDDTMARYEAFVETGSFFSPEHEAAYEAAWRRQQQRRQADDPLARGVGQTLGVAATSAIPFAGASRVVGPWRQAAMQALTGGGMNMLAGSGAAAPGQRAETAGEDFATGAILGASAVPLTTVGRKVVQTFGPGRVDASASADILQDAGLDVSRLRQRAAEYQAATGQGARIADLLTPDEAQRFTSALSRSGKARARVLDEFEAARTDLPQNLSGRTMISAQGPQQIIGPEEIRRRTTDLGNIEFGAVRDRPFQMDDFGRQSFLDDVLPYVNLPRADRDAIRNTLEQGGDITFAEADLIRQKLAEMPGANVTGRPYAQMLTDLRSEMERQSPEYAQALQNMAQRLEVATGNNPNFLGGAELGRAAVGNAPTMDIADAMRRQGPLGQQGAALGARSGLYNEALESPSKSYALARRLKEDSGFQQRVRSTMGQQEADDLINFATTQKRGVDAIAALARIPQDRIETLLDSTEEMTDAVVAAGLGAGGAFKANLANQFFRSIPIGRGAADRLAEDLLNPERRERVFQILERAGLPKTGVRELVQGAFIATGVALSTADRVPEGVPAPQETVTMGVPQQ